MVAGGTTVDGTEAGAGAVATKAGGAGTGGSDGRGRDPKATTDSVCCGGTTSGRAGLAGPKGGSKKGSLGRPLAPTVIAGVAGDDTTVVVGGDGGGTCDGGVVLSEGKGLDPKATTASCCWGGTTSRRTGLAGPNGSGKIDSVGRPLELVGDTLVWGGGGGGDSVLACMVVGGTAAACGGGGGATVAGPCTCTAGGGGGIDGGTVKRSCPPLVAGVDAPSVPCGPSGCSMS